MQHKKKKNPSLKAKLHKNNRHQGRYNLDILTAKNPELLPFVSENVHGDNTIDFANPVAVKALNKALLQHYYRVDGWDIPAHYLCPPVPGRADYIHHITDVLSSINFGNAPQGEKIRCLDIGTGANFIYPIIGVEEYGWSFVGTDIDQVAVENARKILSRNSHLQEQVEIRLQPNASDVLNGVILENERFDLSICNPPFHASAEDAMEGTLRKLKNLKLETEGEPVLNFGGQHNELWCDGGEESFIRKYILQSKEHAKACLWFSSLVAKQSHLRRINDVLAEVGVAEQKTILMGQGNKSSRIIAWTFHTKEAQLEWAKTNWKVEAAPEA